MGYIIILGIDINDNVQTLTLSLVLKKLESLDAVLSSYPFASPQLHLIGIRIKSLLKQFGSSRTWILPTQDICHLIAISLLHHQMDIA